MDMEPTTIGQCPVNGHKGRSVERQTLQSLLLIDLRLLTAERYWFCADPSCPVVYFDEAGTLTFNTDQVRVPVWQKQPDDPETPVCYCFKFTAAMIRDDAEHHHAGNRRTIVEQITLGTQQGWCACPITNPQGSCCLGNVRHVARSAPTPVRREPVIGMEDQDEFDAG